MSCFKKPFLFIFFFLIFPSLCFAENIKPAAELTAEMHFSDDRRAANGGDLEAQYRLALDYDGGLGTPENDALAIRWFVKAADAGHPLAQFRAGEAFSCGCATKRDLDKADFYLNQSFQGCLKAANSGSPDAELYLGIIYSYGWAGQKIDAKASGDWFAKAAAQGSANAAYYLGIFEKRKKASEVRFQEAKKGYELLAEADQAGAYFMLGQIYKHGYGVEQDKAKALEYFQRAADRGVGPAFTELGEAYLSQTSKSQKGIGYLERGAALGHDRAMDQLATAFDKGKAVVADEMEAKKWLLAAAEQGNIHSQKVVAQYYERGTYFPKNKDMAAKWRGRLLRNAAHDILNSEAWDGLIWLREHEDTSDGDRAEILELIKLAAKNGRPPAISEMRRLGWFASLSNFWARNLFLLGAVLPIVFAWVLAYWHGRKKSLRSPAARIAEFQSVAIASSFLTSTYLAIIFLGMWPFGTRSTVWITNFSTTLALHHPLVNFKFSMGAYFILSLMAIASGGSLAIQASCFRAEKLAKGLSWGFLGYLAWRLKNQALRILPQVLIFMALVAGKLLFPNKVELRLISMLAFVLLAAYLQPFAIRILFGMEKIKTGVLSRIARRLGKHTGIIPSGIYLWDTSASKMANAMVMGSVRLNRSVIVTSQLKKNLKPNELEAVLAHEYGHIREGHLWKIAAAAGLFLFLAYLVFPWWLLWAGFLPFILALRRHFERKADAFSIQVTKGKISLKSALVKLTRLNYSPTEFGFYRRIFSTHPSLKERLEHIRAFCMFCSKGNRVLARHCSQCGKKLSPMTFIKHS
jgi:TPR repeat protein/Zn-dependent protease with chaperone function